MSLVVQKYGGSSVGSLDHIRNVARHVEHTVRAGNHVLVTISAMGEQTDELLDMALKLNKRPPRRELDMLLSAGERVSAALLAIALADRGVKALSLTGSQCGILTDETHGNARIHKILGDRIRLGLDAGNVIIVAGFQGVSPRTKEITTLGRGGSDLSAVALAASLGATACQLYKDVPGVLTADPRAVPAARLLPTITWGAMSTLAWAGASVLQPRSAHIASKFNIPFEIRSSLELDRPGTLVRGQEAMETPKIVAFAHKMQTSLIQVRFAAQGGKSGAHALGKALSWLWEHGESPLLSQQHIPDRGVTDLTLVMKTGLVDDFVKTIVASEPSGDAAVALLRRQDGLATITMVGEGFQQSPETVQRVCETLDGAALVIDARNTAITVCVPEPEVGERLQELHREFLSEH